jgi:hypothetical protein
VKNAPDAKIKLAVEGGAMASETFIVNSDVTVIGMGGFMGTDNAPSVDLLKQWQSEGSLGFVLAGGAGGFGGRGGGVAQERTQWVQQNCKVVPASAYGGGSQTLYDCVTK